MSSSLIIKRPQELLAKIALAQVGLQESPRGSNRGPDLLKFFQADNLEINGRTDGYYWCASYVCWCVQEWMRQLGDKAPRIKAPRTAAAFGLEDWAMSQNCEVYKGAALKLQRVLPGDILTYPWSHCGIGTGCNPDLPIFSASEGNSDSQGSRNGFEVALRPRKFSDRRALIRIPARAFPV